jgi:hypothetical protein
MLKKYFTMKKIILCSIAVLTLFVANAQNKKKKNHKKVVNKEAVANARFMKNEAVKKLQRDSLLIGLRFEDSLRIAGDSIADLQKDSASLAYRENGIKMIDSLNNEKYTAIGTQRSKWDKSDKTQFQIASAVGLNEYKSRQMKIINQSYNEKAKVILESEGAVQKSQQLVSLNDERRSKLKTLLGKGQEKKVEKARKNNIKLYGSDEDSDWMNINESVAKK